jgi:Zn-dependent peptidase ImmA (M78 family)/DNA-binding XRE family transcriptional regulator
MGLRIFGFDGARLKEAREARDCTVLCLAETIGKSPQAIYKYEQNESAPIPAVLEAIAKALNIPVPFFTQGARAVQANTVFYRSMSTATKHARARANWRLEWLQDMVEYLQAYVEFPSVNLPDLELPRDPILISNEEIEDAAREARRFWGMSETAPVGNMISLVENHGVIVSRHNLGAATLDSLSVIGSRDGRPYIVIGADKGSAVRWRFDVAHELGHLLLHATVDKGQLAKSERYKLIEQQAHRFALSFLLPLESFCDDLFAPNLDVLRNMKPKWKVSIAAMIMRSRDSELFSEQSNKSLWMNLSRRGWRAREPLDEEMPAEEPRLLRRAIEMIIESKVQTSEDILVSLHLPAPDIESLAGLPDGYLGRDFTPVQMLTRPTEAVPRHPEANHSANVVSLPTRKQEPKQEA